MVPESSHHNQQPGSRGIGKNGHPEKHQKGTDSDSGIAWKKWQRLVQLSSHMGKSEEMVVPGIKKEDPRDRAEFG